MDPYVGTMFVQNLCYHLRFVNRVRVKGMRDLYEAHFDFVQETAKELFFNNQWPGCGGGNEIPLYLSTIVCNRKVGFQIVAPEKRSRCIYYYYVKSNHSQYLEEYCKTMKTEPKFEFQQIIIDIEYAFWLYIYLINVFKNKSLTLIILLLELNKL